MSGYTHEWLAERLAANPQLKISGSKSPRTDPKAETATVVPSEPASPATPHKPRKDYKIERSCGHCQKQFVPKKLGRRHKGLYCSRKCYQENLHARGTVILECAQCGSTFERKASARISQTTYCSHSCQSKGQVGAGNPCWRDGASKRVNHVCEHCGSAFSGTAYQLGRFCSKNCTIKHIAKSGNENPNWRGGKAVACANCGKTTWRQPSWTCEIAYCSLECFKVGEFATRKAKRWNKGKWGLTSARSGKRADLEDRFFRSSWEANYARYLNFLVSAKSIWKWEYEIQTFEFKGIKRGTRFYTPDFKVYEKDGSYAWHEVKGWMNPKSKTQLSRMSRYHPDEKVIVIDSKAYRAIAKQFKTLPNWE